MKIVLASVLLMSACAMGGDEGGEDVESELSTTYVDIAESSKVDPDRWFDVTRHLNQKFVEECATGCGGPYESLVPLSFSCSVSSKLASVHECSWTFASANLQVDTRNARVLVDAPTFKCRLFANIYAPKLLPILEGADPLHAALPNAEPIMRQLEVCFMNPIGMNPPELAKIGNESYVAASEYYTTAANRTKWSTARAALTKGFDNVCGDTFCSSDFSDIQDMGFECSVTKSTGNIKSCAWVFSGSYHWLRSENSGALEVVTKSWNCPVAVKGTISQLITALTEPGTTEATRRILPGTTKTAYDALLDCNLSQ